MAKQFIQNIETKRFIEVLDYLIKERIVKNDTEFARNIDMHRETVTQLRTEKRNVTIELLSNLFRKFKVNPIFIFSGEDSMLLDDRNPALTMTVEPVPTIGTNATVAELKKEVEKLQKMQSIFMRQAELNISYASLLEEKIKELESVNNSPA